MRDAASVVSVNTEMVYIQERRDYTAKREAEETSMNQTVYHKINCRHPVIIKLNLLPPPVQFAAAPGLHFLTVRNNNSVNLPAQVNLPRQY